MNWFNMIWIYLVWIEVGRGFIGVEKCATSDFIILHEYLATSQKGMLQDERNGKFIVETV